MAFPRRLITKGAMAALIVSLGTVAAGTGVALADSGNNITTVAGTKGSAGYSGDGGVAVKAQLNIPTGVSEDLTGAIYIGDSANNVVRKVVSPDKPGSDIITTVAGNAKCKTNVGDGNAATNASLCAPTGTAVDSSGNIYIADTGHNRIREVVKSTRKIMTVAGNGTCSSSLGDGGTATSASLCVPTGVAVNASGTLLFISDTGHNGVRVVGPAGTINRYAGTGSCGFTGDNGSATSAKICAPSGLGLDSTGNLFIADTGNSRVREVTVSDKKIHTVAGNGHFGYSGDNGPATSASLNAPTGVAPDSQGNVFIADTLNNRIRKVVIGTGTTGTITTYAGNGTRGSSGDGGPATSASLNTPTGSAVMDGGALYFADTGNQVVRGVFNGPAPVLPETTLLILIPIGTALILGGGTLFVLRRRRRVSPAVV
jgi:trimeric autotransporter adhesin